MERTPVVVTRCGGCHRSNTCSHEDDAEDERREAARKASHPPQVSEATARIRAAQKRSGYSAPVKKQPLVAG